MYSVINVWNIKPVRTALLWVVFGIIIAFSFRESHLDIRSLVEGLPYAAALVSDMFPPNMYALKKILFLAAETIAMGIWSTLIGIAASIPLGLISAKNTAPNILVYTCGKLLVNSMRAMPDLVCALIFVTSFGLGPVAGILGLLIPTVGTLAKFYAEAIESIDTGPVEAVKAAGSHGLSIIRHAVVPQVFPLFMGYNLYMLDHNIRAAMTLGLVGAGGLGFELFRQMRSFHYHKASAILVVVFFIITIIDRLSSYLRNGITEGNFLASQRRLKDWSLLSVFCLITVLSVFLVPLNINEIVAGIPRIRDFLSGMFPPDFSAIGKDMHLMLETVGMGVSGTFIAMLIAVPLGILSAKNITRSPLIYNIAKEITNFFRAMPELMFALIFVAAVGLGPFAGVLALALHTTGFLGKFYAEAIENVDPKPVEATEATGASFLQIIRHAIFPQVSPLFHSYNLYILDRNIRASTLLGIVGAGGIGFELVMSMKLFDYRSTATLMIIILTTVMLVDWASSYLRNKVVA